MNWIFESIGAGITPKAFFLGLAVSLLCGILVALCASFRTRTTRSFIISLILLPMIVHTVITMVNDVSTGIAVMGAFSLVRFRSVPGKARDIVSIFLAMTAGLACASGYVWVALAFTVAVCAVYLILAFLPMGETSAQLRIMTPESLRYAHEFDDLFAEYTTSHRLIKAKTTNMGSLYKLTYRVRLKDPEKNQEFIDKLRCRNGNLEISISEDIESFEEL